MTNIANLYEAYLTSTGISTDTRTIANGSIFFALKGSNFDANDMVGDALNKGASFIVTTNKNFADDPRAFVVSDTLSTLQALAAEHRRHFNFPVVGITGTNGKTTTKELVTAVLSRKYKTYATKGNLNNQIGVPLTILSIGSDAQMAVVEMGASHPGDIKELVDIAMPSSGLITNVGIAHIQGFGSFEGVKRTKAELYDNLRSSGGHVFLDTSNEHLVSMLGDYPNIVPYLNGQVVDHGETLTFQMTLNGQHYTVRTQLTGDYNIANALAAATVGSFYGVAPSDIVSAIENYAPTNGRSQIVQTRRNRIVLDAYNANPSSMDAALTNFAKSSAEHKAVILGAMRELGSEEETQHRHVLNRLAQMNLDTVLLIGEEFARFAADYPQFHFFLQTQDVFPIAETLTGKYILVKGSNSNKLSSLTERL